MIFTNAWGREREREALTPVSTIRHNTPRGSVSSRSLPRHGAERFTYSGNTAEGGQQGERCLSIVVPHRSAPGMHPSPPLPPPQTWLLELSPMSGQQAILCRAAREKPPWGKRLRRYSVPFLEGPGGVCGWGGRGARRGKGLGRAYESAGEETRGDRGGEGVGQRAYQGVDQKCDMLVPLGPTANTQCGYPSRRRSCIPTTPLWDVEDAVPVPKEDIDILFPPPRAACSRLARLGRQRARDLGKKGSELGSSAPVSWRETHHTHRLLVFLALSIPDGPFEANGEKV